MSTPLISRRLALALGLSVGLAGAVAANAAELLNVSYDPTRELYQEFNAAFAKHWKATTGEDVTIKQSHGGSGKQARAVIDGLDADVVTLALAGDIDGIAEKGKLLPADWQKRLAAQQHALHLDHRVPGPQGQPEGHQGLGRSGQGRRPGDHAEPEDLGRRAVELSRRMGISRSASTAATTRPRSSSRSSTRTCRCSIRARAARPRRSSSAASATCSSRGRTKHSSAQKELGPDKFEIVVPSISILAEPPVAVVDKNVDKKGTRKVAEAYLQYLYSPEGQEIAGKNFYRPTDEKVAAKYADQFPKINLFTIDDAFGGWCEGLHDALQGRRHVRPDLRAQQQELSSLTPVSDKLRLRLGDDEMVVPWPEAVR